MEGGLNISRIQFEVGMQPGLFHFWSALYNDLGSDKLYGDYPKICDTI